MSQDLSKLEDTIHCISADKLALNGLVKAFEEIHPMFNSPLYIGKAPTSLKKRLKQHTTSIARIREMARHDNVRPCFALEFVKRGLDPTRLEATCIALPGIDEDSISKIEYLLNRTSYPLFGRI